MNKDTIIKLIADYFKTQPDLEGISLWFLF